MAKKSARNPGTTKPLFDKLDKDQDIIVAESDIRYPFLDEKVSFNLKYYQKSCECFSDWSKNDLKKFSFTIDKVRGYNSTDLRRNSSLCKPHKGKPKEQRFSRPPTSKDLPFFEIKIDPANKARIHGFFLGGMFFIVWLDREHACFPE